MSALIQRRRQQDAALLVALQRAGHGLQTAMSAHPEARQTITAAWQPLRQAQEAVEERLAARDLDEVLDRFSVAGDLALTLLNAVDPEQEGYTAAPVTEVIDLAHRLADVLFLEADDVVDSHEVVEPPSDHAESTATPSATNQAAIAEHCRDIARERVAAIQQHLGANAHG